MKKILSAKNNHSVMGDFEEIFNYLKDEKGIFKANLWYRLQVIKSIPSFLINSAGWGADMLKNYFKISLRNLYRNKIYAFINILGLGLALTNAIIGYLNYDYADHFDSFHVNSENIFRVVGVRADDKGTTLLGAIPIPLSPAIKGNVAGIEKFVSVEWNSAAIKYKDNIFNERILYTDEGFFQTFSFPFKAGKIDLNTTSQIVISEEYAQKYFGSENPLGKVFTIIYPNGYMKELEVTGITEKCPGNSSIKFDFVASSELLFEASINEPDKWRFINYGLFLKLDNPVGAESIQSQLKQYLPPDITESENPAYTDFILQPLKDVAQSGQKMRSNYLYKPYPTNNIIVMLLSGMLILLVACFNYINTSLAFASKKFREIGVRKTLGSTRLSLVTQTMSENIIFCVISLIFAVILAVTIGVPGYNDLSGGETQLEFSPLKNIRLLIFLFGLLIGTGILSGLYPALIISKFNPVGILRGKQKTSKTGFLTRILLSVQFTISLIAVIATILFAQNAEYTKNFDLGYEKNNVVSIPVRDGQSYNLFKNNIEDNPRIENISGSRHHILTGGRKTTVKSGATENDSYIFDIGFNYIETIKLRLKDGRSFDERTLTDIDQSIIVNEEFSKQMGWDNSIGKLLTIDEHSYKVIGTLQNFWTGGTFIPAIPAVFKITPPENFSKMQVLVNPDEIQTVYSTLKETWDKLFPYRPFEGYYYDRALAAGINLNIAIKKWAFAVAFIAIVIAAMGLFAMVSLQIANRTKEIGIRKVLGASIPNIMRLLNKEIVLILFISIILGNLAGYYLIKILLDSIYTYHVAVGLSALLTADIILVATAVVTIGSNIWKAANANPVESLRTE
ncbi:ABC transporter permease [Bacteroidota bacterium]